MAINRDAYVFLVGTKFDKYSALPDDEKKAITARAKQFASMIQAPLIYCSSARSINVKKLFQIVIAEVFGIKAPVDETDDPDQPIVIFFQRRRDRENCSLNHVWKRHPSFAILHPTCIG
jgi:GTP-binding protein of the ras superfamily involved in termination of M-phase